MGPPLSDNGTLSPNQDYLVPYRTAFLLYIQEPLSSESSTDPKLSAEAGAWPFFVNNPALSLRKAAGFAKQFSTAGIDFRPSAASCRRPDSSASPFAWRISI